jgi:MFS family permease
MAREASLGRPFWRLFTAGAISALGDGLVMVGFPLLALTLTTSPILIAGVAIAGRLPAFLCSVPAGALADRLDRRRMVIAVNLIRAAALGIFSVVVVEGHDSLPALYATVFVLGAGDMAFDVATQACLPAMVSVDDLPRANGYLFTAEVSGEQVVGPGLGGLAFAAARSLPFIGDAVSFVASTLLIRTALPDTPARQDHAPFLADIRDGMRWFFGHRLLRLLGLVVASLAFCQAMVFSELVLYGSHELGLSHAEYGLFYAGACTGDVVGSLAAGRIFARLGPASCLNAAAVVAGLAYVSLSITHAPAIAALALFLEAVGVAIGNVTVLSLRQRVTPANLLGRVGSTFRLLIWGLIPFGALAGGLVAAQMGVRDAFGVAGVLQLSVIAVAAPTLLARIRQAEPPIKRPPVGVHPDGLPATVRAERRRRSTPGNQSL